MRKPLAGRAPFAHDVGVLVRRIRPEDAKLLRELRLAALQDTPDAFAATYDEEAARPFELWEQQAAARSEGAADTNYLAFDDTGRAVGLVGAYGPGEPPADRELVAMWVAPDARGRGVGEALVDAVAGWAAAGGASVLGLWVTRGNDAALALYRRSGFELTDATQPLPSNPCKDELRMVRRLGS